MPSWDVLVNMTLPIQKNYQSIENIEDRYSVMFIECCNHRLVAPVYHDLEYVSGGLGGIELNKIDFDRLMRKFESIMDVYNASNDLHLIGNYKIINQMYLQVDIESTNTVHTVDEVGQIAVLRQGATYWESSWNDGSGQRGSATVDNPFIPETFTVIVNGFSYFDESRASITENYYKPYHELYEETMPIMPWERRMVHICTENFDIGWVYPEDLVRIG